MKENELIEIKSVADIEDDIESYFISDNKLIVTNTWGDKYSLNYSFDNELDVYNNSNSYLKQIEGNKKAFSCVSVVFILIALVFCLMSCLATTIIPLFIVLLTSCFTYATFGIIYAMKLISLLREHRNVKKQCIKLKEFLKFKKIDIDSKLHKKSHNHSKENNSHSLEVSKVELPSINKINFSELEEIEDFENYNIESFCYEQLKQLNVKDEVEKQTNQEKVKTLVKTRN